MKYIILFLFLFINLSLFGQNELWDRSFWKSKPSIDQVKTKIATGNDPIALNPNAFDATVYAILGKAPLKTIQFLLDMEGNGADKMTHDGRSYLIWAAYSGEPELVKDLIKRGSDIDLVDDHGNTAVTFAAGAGMINKEVYDILIEAGADIAYKNRTGANALLLIAPRLKDDFSILKYFKKKGLKLNSTDNNGNGLFNYAARSGNRALMEKAMEWKLPYKEKNRIGGNAILEASRGYRSYTNPLEMYQYLVGLGLEAKVKTESGETPLHNIARRVKDPAIYEFFINKGVDINQSNKDGNTLLLNAINGGNTDIAFKFISKVADLNHQNKNGYSALTYAMRRGQLEVVAKLLTKGADAKVEDKKGNNLAAHLYETFQNSKKEQFEASLKILKKQGIALDAKQAKGNNLLHLAVNKHNMYLVKKALELGNDLNAKNDDGLTPIHLAAMKAKDPKILTFLIEKGADKNIKTDFEESVYDLAAENELLQKAGFNLDVLKK